MARNHRSGHQAGANDGGRGDPAALGPDVLLGIWSTWLPSRCGRNLRRIPSPKSKRVASYRRASRLNASQSRPK